MHVIVLKKTSILPRHVAAQWGAAIWGKKTDWNHTRLSVLRIATGTLRPWPVASRMNSGCLAIEICSGFCGRASIRDFQSSTSWLWLYQSYIYSNVSIYEYAITSNFTCMFIYPTYLYIVILSYSFILRCLMAQWHYTYITYIVLYRMGTSGSTSLSNCTSCGSPRLCM